MTNEILLGLFLAECCAWFTWMAFREEMYWFGRSVVVVLAIASACISVYYLTAYNHRNL